MFGYEEELQEEIQRLCDKIEALEAKNKELEQEALTDSLTGLWNFRYFQRCLPAEMNRAYRNIQDLFLYAVDANDFKQVNDTYGHAAGDKVLAAISQALRETFKRASDYIFRIGGDEFAVISSDEHNPFYFYRGENTAAEMLRKNVVRCTTRIGCPTTVAIGVSYQTAANMPRGNENVELFLQRMVTQADQAMYADKAAAKSKDKTL